MIATVKDMEKPETCHGCRFWIDADYCAAAKKTHDGSAVDRLRICPVGEIIQCKDCKWYTDSAHIDHIKMCKLLGVYPAPDGYCYAGKRR